MATPSFVTKQGVDARHKPGMTVESHRQELRHRYSFLHPLLRHAGALPRGASRRVSVQIVGFEPFAPPTEGSGAPKFPGADRRTRWLALRLSPSLPREGTARP